MLTVCFAIGLLMLGFALVWILKGFVVGSSARLSDIDVIAFRNVLSLHDNHVLRERLSEGAYRRVKRARVRAVQEYVKAIAGDCAITIAVLRAKAPDSAQSVQCEVSSLVREALAIRLLCLAFWIVLWAEFVFPNLEIRPMRIAGGYERLRSGADRCLRSAQAASPAL